MILDTSALVAILYGEPEARDFVERIRAADVCRISVANHVELSMVVESQLGPDHRQADAFLRRAGVVVEPVTVEQGDLARRLFSTSAKAGTKRPELWRPICLRARQSDGEALLFKGDDFALTDIRRA